MKQLTYKPPTSFHVREETRALQLGAVSTGKKELTGFCENELANLEHIRKDDNPTKFSTLYNYRYQNAVLLLTVCTFVLVRISSNCVGLIFWKDRLSTVKASFVVSFWLSDVSTPRVFFSALKRYIYIGSTYIHSVMMNIYVQYTLTLHRTYVSSSPS